MSDQATPHNEATNVDLDVDRATDPAAKHEVGETMTVRVPATEVAFPWLWALVGLVVLVLAVVIALVTESQGIGLR